MSEIKKSAQLEMQNIEARGWLLDVLECLNLIPTREFSLNDVYRFEETLAAKHPKNNNVKAKIRQQLQILRDKGFLEFTPSRGVYRKIL